MFSRVEIRLARNKLSGKAYNIQQAILHSWTTNIPVVVNRFVHESAVTIWFLSASATYSFRVISGENSCIHSLWRGEKKRGKKEKNSDRPIPRKLFRRLPFLNAIHSVNKKEERLDTMVAGYYLLANYTWARSGENFRPGYNKPSYPSSLPPPPPSTPLFPPFYLSISPPCAVLIFNPCNFSIGSSLVYFGHRVQRARATLGNTYYAPLPSSLAV